jgi:hypothetical protein
MTRRRQERGLRDFYAEDPERADWLVEEQGMAELAPEDRALILDDLEQAFGQNVARS